MKLNADQSIPQRVDILAQALETAFERRGLVCTENQDRCLFFADLLGDRFVSIREIANELEALLS